jgi:hypothetical protein
MQSSPSRTSLKNTCTGIHRIRTFKENMRIRRADYEADMGVAHLELVFYADDTQKPGEKFDIFSKYGGL